LSYLVDTNVFSAVLADRPDLRVSEWLEGNQAEL